MTNTEESGVDIDSNVDKVGQIKQVIRKISKRRHEAEGE